MNSTRRSTRCPSSSKARPSQTYRVPGSSGNHGLSTTAESAPKFAGSNPFPFVEDAGTVAAALGDVSAAEPFTPGSPFGAAPSHAASETRTARSSGVDRHHRTLAVLS